MSCCCFCSGEDDPARAPLLRKTNGHQAPISEQPASARKYRATHMGTESPLILPIECKEVKVRNVDKRLRDHAQLFNDHLIRNQKRKDAIDQLKEMGGEEKTLTACFTRLRNYNDNPDAFTVKRNSKYCMEVDFEAKEVDYRLAAAFKAFNTANKLTKELLDKGPGLIKTIQLVTSNENELRRDVLVASLGEDGPDCMKHCMENIEQLRKVPSVVEAVRKETESDFEELKSSMKLFLEEIPQTPSPEQNLNLAPSEQETLVDLQEGSGHHEGHLDGRGSTSDHVTQNLSVPEAGDTGEEMDR